MDRPSGRTWTYRKASSAIFDFDDGVQRFADEVMPLLDKRGLREPFAGGVDEFLTGAHTDV